MNGPVLEVKMKNIQEISSLIAQKIEVESQKKVNIIFTKKCTWHSKYQLYLDYFSTSFSKTTKD